MPASHPCPQCHQPADAAGHLHSGVGQLPVYQCEHCTKTVDFGGSPLEVALTFVVDASGRAYDPADDGAAAAPADAEGPTSGVSPANGVSPGRPHNHRADPSHN